MASRVDLVDRLGRLHQRYRRPFWIAHSMWALASGAFVVWLARERYHLVPWVVGLLGLTWLSTLVLGRAGSRVAASRVSRFSSGVASYLTRVMYQETLLFLLPLYAASTTLRSPNAVFTGLLAALAILACLDLVFDRLLRERPGFAFAFFATVTFAAVNVLLPILAAVPPAVATPLAALVAFVSAAPLALTDGRGLGAVRVVGMTSAACLLGALVLLARPALPPAPLRIVEPVFGTGIDRETLEVQGRLGGSVALSDLSGVVVFRCRLVAPSNFHTGVELRWDLDGAPLHAPRAVEVTAHRGGFRLWDSTRRAQHQPRPGRYRVSLVSAEGQLLGRATLVVLADDAS